MTESSDIPAKLDGSIQLWRYMDLSKLLSILENKEIVFQAPTSFSDPFENLIHVQSDDALFDRIRQSVIEQMGEFPESLDDSFKSHFNTSDSMDVFLTKGVARSILVSCWHMNDYESEAMWKLYAESNRGVAIRTTVSKLHSILPEGLGDIYPIQYIDHGKANENLHRLRSYFYKCKSFEFESEARAFFLDLDKLLDSSIETVAMPLKCSPADLIDEIIVSPFSEHWYYELLKKIIARYEYNIPINKSSKGIKPSHLIHAQ